MSLTNQRPLDRGSAAFRQTKGFRPRSTIRETLSFVFGISILFAIPSWTVGVSLTPSLQPWVVLLYNALLFAAAGWGIGLIFGARRLFLTFALSIFVVVFAPELIFAMEYSLTGDNENTGPWLAEHGLDYDPAVYVSLAFDTSDS